MCAQSDIDEALAALRLVHLEFQRRPECLDMFPHALLERVRNVVDLHNPPVFDVLG
jgi:hypothetical protein